MSRYIALIHRGEAGSWGVSFPDFPGCIAAADSFEEVVDAGAQALRFHVEGMIEDGQAIPAPRGLAALRDDPEFEDDFADAIVTLMPLLPPRSKPMRVNVSLDANLLIEIDAKASELGMNRSEFLAEGARRLIVQPSGSSSRARGHIGSADRIYAIQQRAVRATQGLAERPSPGERRLTKAGKKHRVMRTGKRPG